MSISIPTDSLNKFIAIGSIVLMIALLNLCVENYTKAELSWIDTSAKAEELENVCEELCPQVDILSNRLKTYKSHLDEFKNNQNKTRAELEALSKEIEDINADIKELKLTIEKAKTVKIQLNVSTRKSELFYKIRSFWIAVGVIVFVLCTISSFWGFRGWYYDSKRTTTN